MQKLYLIDALGPFYEPVPGKALINWSKIDFAGLETAGQLSLATQDRIVARFQEYARRVAELGYNALSLDDVAHAVNQSFYRPELQRRISQYQVLYRRLCEAAKTEGLAVYFTTDYLFRNTEINAELRRTGQAPAAFLAGVMAKMFELFPSVQGIVLRVGEHDGQDVTGDFLSRVEARRPHQIRALLACLLPICEQHNAQLIFRTWTVGMYPAGDLIWNHRTLTQAVEGLTSDRLILSMKYGDTDFMRHLALNPLLLTGRHRVIVELQARREWEGMGLFPSFVGWDYAEYLQQLRSRPEFAGIQVWCQTGGWSQASWNTVAFMGNGAFWNELNAAVTLQLAIGDVTVEQAIAAFCTHHAIDDTKTFIELLRLSDQAVKEGLYVREFAQQSRYFRRTRLPSLAWITWDRLVTEPVFLGLLRALVRHPVQALHEGQAAATAANYMVALGQQLRLPAPLRASLAFERDTLVILALVRHCIWGPADTVAFRKLEEQLDLYVQRYPHHYRIDAVALREALSQAPRPALGRLMALATRRRARYRLVDRLALATSPLQRWLITRYLHRTGSPLERQAMGLESIFK